MQNEHIEYRMDSQSSDHVSFDYIQTPGSPSTTNTAVPPLANSYYTNMIPLEDTKSEYKFQDFAQTIKKDKSQIPKTIGATLEESCLKKNSKSKLESSANENNLSSPNYFMNLFLDNYVINLLVEGTNWFINNVPRNRKNKIAPVNPGEIRCVLAVLYLSGYVNLPRVRMFWEKAADTSFPLVVDAIPRDRFETIFTNIHAINSPSTEKKDPLSRISALVDSLRNRFMQFSPVEEIHSVDELNVPYYKQATGLRQFTKTKSMKVWCGCTNSGYCTWFDHIEEIQIESSSFKPHIAVNKIFMYATKISNFKIPKCLIYDNVFNDARIVNELRELKIEAKPVPNRISMSVSKSQGANNALENFKDQSKVHNSPMGGVDKLDQNVNLYPISIIGKKWTFHFLLAYVLDLAIQNAWQLYRGNNENCLDLLGFRRSIVTYYLTRYGKPIIFKSIGSRKRIIKKTQKNGDVVEVPVLKSHYYRCKDVRYDGIEHYVIPQSKQTRCFHCKMKTTTRCSKCDIGIHVKCFVDYHTRTDSVNKFVKGTDETGRLELGGNASPSDTISEINIL